MYKVAVSDSMNIHSRQNIFFLYFTWYQSREKYPSSSSSFFLLPFSIMANEHSSDGGKSDAASPYFLHHSDHPGMVLVSKPLNGDNYSTWCRAMTISLNAKSKLGFVDGTITVPPAKTKPDDHASWKRCNDMILSWILNSLTPDLADSVIYSNTAQEVWEDLRDHFHQSNAPPYFSD